MEVPRAEIDIATNDRSASLIQRIAVEFGDAGNILGVESLRASKVLTGKVIASHHAKQAGVLYRITLPRRIIGRCWKPSIRSCVAEPRTSPKYLPIPIKCIGVGRIVRCSFVTARISIGCCVPWSNA
jgi:hypothetical protein